MINMMEEIQKLTDRIDALETNEVDEAFAVLVETVKEIERRLKALEKQRDRGVEDAIDAFIRSHPVSNYARDQLWKIVEIARGNDAT